jgi:4-hydroxybenzoate polyprenyltransferase
MTFPNPLRQKLDLYAKLIRLDKPIGILLLLWPTMWALFAAQSSWPDFSILVIFVLGTILMRSAGCAINDYFDRDIDKHVKRTEQRVLTSGRIHPKEALLVAGFLALISFILILPLNGLTLKLSFCALGLAASYPLFKRFFAIPQAYLGVAFGFGIPMGFAAIQDHVPKVAWIMLIANIFWAIAYDTEYAMVDRDDDLRLGLKTSAITFGQYDLFFIALCYFLTLVLLCWAGAILGYGWCYALGLFAAMLIALFHLYLIRGRERAACFRAFLHNTWFGFAIFAGIFAQTVLLPMLKENY